MDKKKTCVKCKGEGSYLYTSKFLGYGLSNLPPELGTLTIRHNCQKCGGNEWQKGTGYISEKE